jgi:imidazolonepropionase-like amidohydrolase
LSTDHDLAHTPTELETAETMHVQPVKILAGTLFDSYTGELLPNRLIVVSPESGLILDVTEYEDSDAGLIQAAVDLSSESTIDLRDQTVLPGFVDAHVHRKFNVLESLEFRIKRYYDCAK